MGAYIPIANPQAPIEDEELYFNWIRFSNEK